MFYVLVDAEVDKQRCAREKSRGVDGKLRRYCCHYLRIFLSHDNVPTVEHTRQLPSLRHLEHTHHRPLLRCTDHAVWTLVMVMATALIAAVPYHLFYITSPDQRHQPLNISCMIY